MGDIAIDEVLEDEEEIKWNPLRIRRSEEKYLKEAHEEEGKKKYAGEQEEEKKKKRTVSLRDPRTSMRNSRRKHATLDKRLP